MRNVCVICSLLLLAGCGGESFPLAPVSGRVTVDGQPVKEARVAFEPIAQEGTLLAGPGSYGKTDASGRYELRSIEGQSGAVVGPHRVSISTAVTSVDGAENAVEELPDMIPLRYRDGTSPLTFTVPASGSAAADFTLSTR